VIDSASSAGLEIFCGGNPQVVGSPAIVVGFLHGQRQAEQGLVSPRASAASGGPCRLERARRKSRTQTALILPVMPLESGRSRSCANSTAETVSPQRRDNSTAVLNSTCDLAKAFPARCIR